MLALVGLAAFAPSQAKAAPSVGCPTPIAISVPSGGSLQINASSCDPVGTNPQNRVVQPAHGHVTIDNAAAGLLTYVNNGDGALSDTFTFEDASAGVVTVNVTVGAATSPITVTPANLPTPAIGVFYDQTLSSSGGVAPYTYTPGGGSLPPGLTLAANGRISGTPTGSGPYNYTVHVVDSTAGTHLTTDKSYSFLVPGPTLVVSPTNPPAGATGFAYSQQLSTSGGTAPYTYSIESGSPPAGLSLSSSGLISGTPSAVGTVTFKVKSQDSTTISTGGVWLVTQDITIVINAAPTIVVNPATVPGGTVGTAYTTTTFSGSGGTGPYTFAISAGALPAGLSLNPTTGALSGTPTAGGTFNFTVRATDASSSPGPFNGTQAYTLTVAPPTVTLPATTLTNGTLGSAYAANLNAASGGTAPYTYVVTAGALPPGITLTAGTGALSGTPNSAGTFNFAVTATDSSTGSGPYSSPPRGYSLQIVNIPPVANAVSATVAYDSGANPITLNITGGVPTSVAIASAAAHGTAIASGTSITYQPNPGYAGPDSFTYTATNGAGTSAPATVTITVGNPTITVTPSDALTAQIGVAYTQTFTASGGATPYTLAVTGMPAGLTQTGTTANSVTISGTPTAAGSFTLTVAGTDSSTGNGPFAISQPFTLSVSAPTLGLTPAAGTLSATYGTAFSQQYTASGGTAPYTYTISAGALPTGLSLDPGTGLLSGTPTVTGLFTFSARATDSSTGSGAPFARTQNYVMQVAAPTIRVAPPTLPAGATAASPYTATISATGGIGPYSFTVSAGALPTGLTLDSGTGVLSGTPTQSGTLNFTVLATDANGQTGSRAYSLVVAAPSLTVSPATLPGGALTAAYGPETLTASGGNAPYSFAVTAGVLPTGLTLSSTGALSGTPTAPGTFNFTVTATDATTGTAATGSQAYTVAIADVPPIANPVSATVAYNSSANPIALNITGGAADSVAVASAAGNGTAIASGTSITYTPTAGYAGPDSFTYTATNGSGTSAPATVTIMVGNPTITVAASGPLTAQIGVAYTQTFTWSGGAAPYSGFAVTGLPAGLAITGTTSNSVTVSGTPTAAGSFSLNASATDSSTGNGPFTVGQIFTLTVGAPTLSLTPFGGPLPVPYGAPFSQSFTASGGTSPYTFALAGALPSGLSFDGTTGVLSGTASQTGSFLIGVKATDSSTGTGAPFFVTGNYTLNIAAPTIAINPTTLADATAGAAYSPVSLAASGGIGPYTYTLSSGSLPTGMSISTAGVISGTPTQSGTFPITVQAQDANGQTGTQGYTLQVLVPTLIVLPATLPGGTAGTAYNQPLSASGGNSPYSFAIGSGSLPAGLNITGGALTGTPTVAGTFNFTITATDSTTGTAAIGSQPYALVIAAPTITLAPATLPAGQYAVAYNQTITASGGTAPYSYVMTGTPPTGITLSSAGVLSGTPTDIGSFNITVTATDNLGFTGLANYTLVISNNPPVANPDTADTLEGQPVTVHVTDNDSGTITSVAIATGPGHGTASVSGPNIDYTPAAGFSGQDTLQYTATGPGGTSTPALVTINVRPVPVPVAQTVTTASGKAVTVDLSKDAVGGPFTTAALVSVPPPSEGTTTLNGLQMTFTPTSTFQGTSTVTFTLSNAYATSAVTAITIQVVERPDPTLDSEVMGILNAQTEATRRFATSQIGNFQQRLEGLHDSDNGQEPTDSIAFVQGVVLSFDSTCNEAEQMAKGPDCGRGKAPDANWPFKSSLDDTTTSGTPGGFGSGAFGHSKVTIWTGGSINIGERDGDSGYKFETTGLSAGVDYRFSRAFAMGLGMGYGRDVSDIGDNGSRSKGKAYTAGLYASYHPGQDYFIDGLVGYQWLSFDSRRYLTGDGGFVTGERDGGQWFASVSAGKKFEVEDWQISPYARLDLAKATLDAFTEKGDPSSALHYGEQDISTMTGNLGLTLNYKFATDFGMISPQLRLEYQHDFQGDSAITMNYADMFGGPIYHTSIDGLGKDRFMLGLGVNVQTVQDFNMRLEYRGLFGSDGDTDNGFLVNLGKTF